MKDLTMKELQEEEKLSPELRKVFLALIIGGIAAILDSTMVTLALHVLTLDLHSDAGSIQWVTTAYLLVMAAAIPLSGWAESRWGGRIVWSSALVIFLFGSVLCALAWNGASLIGARVIQGFGGGVIFPLMQTLAVRAAGGKVSPKMMATITLPIALGPILGPVIGGLILNWLSWRWLFLVNVPLVAVGLVLAWKFLPKDKPDSSQTRQKLDLAGLLLLAPALTGLLLGLSQMSRNGGLGHADVLIPLLSGFVLLGIFISWALRPGFQNPIVNIRLLKLPSLASSSLVLFTAGAAMYAVMFLLPLYYQQVRSMTVLEAGLLLIPQGLGALVARFVIGKVIERIGVRTATVASFILAAAATIPFALALPDTSLLFLGIVLFIRGLGIGAVLIPPMSVAYQDIKPSEIQHATMNTRIIQQIGASFGTALVAVVLQSLLENGALEAFKTAFWWGGGISLVALVPSITLPQRKQKS